MNAIRQALFQNLSGSRLARLPQDVGGALIAGGGAVHVAQQLQAAAQVVERRDHQGAGRPHGLLVNFHNTLEVPTGRFKIALLLMQGAQMGQRASQIVRQR